MYYEDEFSVSGLCTPPIEYDSPGVEHFRYDLPPNPQEPMMAFGREESFDLEDLQFYRTSYNDYDASRYGYYGVHVTSPIPTYPSEPSDFQRPSESLIDVGAQALTPENYDYSDLRLGNSSLDFDQSPSDFPRPIDDVQVVPASPARSWHDGSSRPYDDKGSSTTFAERSSHVRDDNSSSYNREWILPESSCVKSQLKQRRQRRPRKDMTEKDKYRHV